MRYATVPANPMPHHTIATEGSTDRPPRMSGGEQVEQASMARRSWPLSLLLHKVGTAASEGNIHHLTPGTAGTHSNMRTHDRHVRTQWLSGLEQRAARAALLASHIRRVWQRRCG